ncbi:MAG: hypothetical protein JW809_12705 [Pirellulales bacterium]|nr:hypothetical protein [Pirellulales bacterium]
MDHQLDLQRQQQEIRDRQQRGTDEMLKRSHEQQDRFGRLLDVWEEQSRRFDAILAKWEQMR